jgi:serine/threonine-protein kinase
VSSKSQTSRVGELVGEKYRILRVIAEGGMGVVYEAQHAVVKRRFAVKFLRTDLADRRDLLTRFHREAQAAGALESENIAAAIDFGIIPDGTPYIVMEHLVGESLGSLLAREGCLPVERAVDLCLQACRGMQAAHAAGIVHRDLKPENLFLCRREDGTDLVKVLDFGIAKLEQIELNSAATRTGTILGTPAYMSPEQARGDKSIDHRTDVYGLAAILFEMLSGKKPHPGDSHNAILHHIATQPAVSLPSVQPDLPAPLVDIVERALSCNRDQRHASVEELALALAPFAKREAWPPPKNTDPIPVVVAASPTPGWRSADFDAATVPASAQPLRRSNRPRKILAISAGLVATAVIAMTMGARTIQRPNATATAPESERHHIQPIATNSLGPAPVQPSMPPAPAPQHESSEGRDRQANAQASIPSGLRPSEMEPRPKIPRNHSGRPLGRPAGRPGEASELARTPSVSTVSSGVTESRSPGVTFDPQNPYGN